MKKINENERNFIENMICLDKNVAKLQKEIMELYGMDSIYNLETSELKLLRTGRINESYDAACAKSLIETKIDKGFLTVIF